MAQDFLRGDELSAARLNRLVSDVGGLARLCGVMPPARAGGGRRRAVLEKAGSLSFSGSGREGDEDVYATVAGCELCCAGGTVLLDGVQVPEALPQKKGVAVAVAIDFRETAHETVTGAWALTPVSMAAGLVQEKAECVGWPLLMGEVAVQESAAVTARVPWLSEQGVIAASGAVRVDDSEVPACVLPAAEPEQLWACSMVYGYAQEGGAMQSAYVGLCACLDPFGYLRFGTRLLKDGFRGEEQNND